MDLCQERRGVFKDMKYPGHRPGGHPLRAALKRDCLRLFRRAEIPHPGLRPASTTSSWATSPSKLVKLDIMLNGEIVDALSFIIHADKAYPRARKMAEKLKEKIPRQLFEVPHPGLHRREDHRPGDGEGPAQGRGWPSATAATSQERRSSWKSRKRARSACASWAPWKCPQEAFMSVLKLDE